jgi:BlaI family transcriptional regulator, penicillinase repressor
MPQEKRPSDLELQILSLLWRTGPLTVRQVMDTLPDKRKRAYTSVLSVMQVMEKKGFLTHTTEGNTHIYKPALSRAKTLGGHMRRLVTQVFGSPAQAVEHLLDESQVTPDDIDQIRRLLDQHNSKSSKKSSKGN